MKILSIDCSSKTVSVSVLDNEHIIGEYFLNAGLTHTQTLLPLIQNILNCTQIALDNIDMVAITNGPGSFTGIRIGISTVKGMFLLSDVKCVPISSLLATTYNIDFYSCYICACVEFRRNKLYNALFNFDGEVNRLTDDKFLSAEELALILKKYQDKHIIFVGDGAEMCYNYLLERYEFSNIYLPNEKYRYIKSSNVGLLALKMYNDDNSIAVTPENLLPNYLKLSQAEENLLKKGDAL